MLQPNALIKPSDWYLWMNLAEPVAGDERTEPLLQQFINESSDEIEKWCGRQFQKKVVVGEVLDGEGLGFIRVSRPPILSVQQIRITDDAGFGTVTIVPATSYYAHTADDSGLIELIRGVTADVYTRFPVGRGNVQVDYTGGFTIIPVGLKRACVLAVAQLWFGAQKDPASVNEGGGGFVKTRKLEDRSGLPPQALALLRDYKATRIAMLTAR